MTRSPLLVPLLALLALNLGLHFGLPEPRTSRSEEQALLFSARLDFDDDVEGDVAVAGSGWHGSEWDDHRTFTWTAARRARVMFAPLRPGRYGVAFAVGREVLPRDPSLYGLLVNGRRIALEHSRNPGLLVFRGEIPPEALPPQRPVRVTLISPPPVAPMYLDPESDDDRLLGAGIDWLAITPRPSAQHVDFVSSVFGSGWGPPEEGGRRILKRSARFSVPPMNNPQVVLQADGPATIQQISPTEFEATGNGLFRHAWVFDPAHVKGDAQALPATQGWSPPGSDPLARPLRWMVNKEATLEIGNGVPARAHVRIGVLARNNPHFPLQLPLHLLPPAAPRLAVHDEELPSTLQGLERVYEGEVLLNGDGLHLRSQGRLAFQWLELTRGR